MGAWRASCALWTLAIPNDSTFLGLERFVQGVVPDAAANAFGAAVSNAVGLLLGGK